MQLKLALRISASAKRITYWCDMFISQEYLFVNSFLSSESLAGIPAIAGLQIAHLNSSAPLTDGIFLSEQRKNSVSGKHLAACSANRRRSPYFREAIVSFTISPIYIVGKYYFTGFRLVVNRHFAGRMLRKQAKRIDVTRKTMYNVVGIYVYWGC